MRQSTNSLAGVTVLFIHLIACAQEAELSPQVQEFVSLDAPVIALVGATIIDGTGAPAQGDQVIVIRDGEIAAIGSSIGIQVPEAAQIVNASGKTIIPGLVMLHEHMFYPSGGGTYNEQAFSFPRLYLAGGVTNLRTAGSIDPYGDLNLKRAIDAGTVPGPTIDVTGPYLNAPGVPIFPINELRGPDHARQMVEYWINEGVTSSKAYMHVSREVLSTIVETSHTHGLKVAGHLCSITYREAANIGIDSLEHGFFETSDFVEDKKPDVCPEMSQIIESLTELDADGKKVSDLIQHLVEKGVALTSTLTVFETMVPGQRRTSSAALDAMSPDARDRYLRIWSNIAEKRPSYGLSMALFQKLTQLERRFFDAGGLLVVGTDSTGYGGVVAGYANQRAIELLVESGFTVEQAIQIATANGAAYLGIIDETGTLELGKTADLVVIDGDLSADISDIYAMETVFKHGIGYDSKRLFESVKGTVGVR